MRWPFMLKSTHEEWMSVSLAERQAASDTYRRNTQEQHYLIDRQLTGLIAASDVAAKLEACALSRSAAAARLRTVIARATNDRMTLANPFV